MNLQPVRIGGTRITGTGRRNSSGNLSGYGAFAVKFILMIIAFMAVLVGHLYLRQQSVKSAERTDDIKQQIMEVKAENRNLRNHVAKLTEWGHISRMIAKFKLELGPAVSGQIITIGVYTPEQAATIPLTPLKVASNMAGASRRR